jgi:acyl-CoA thioester hydrolase
MKSERPITHRGVIYPWQCDQMGHMNVMWYSGKFDEGTWNLFNVIGLTPSYMKENNRGMVAVEQHLTYKRELLAGNLIYIRSGILEVKEKAMRIFHEMFNAETDELAATSMLVGIHFDTVLRKAVPFPEPLAVKAREMIADPGGI